MENDKIWKLRHTIRKDGIILFDAVVNYEDKFKAEMELLRMKETDIIRRDNTEEFEYKDVDGVESWKYSCKEYSREVLVFILDNIGNELRGKGVKLPEWWYKEIQNQNSI